MEKKNQLSLPPQVFSLAIYILLFSSLSKPRVTAEFVDQRRTVLLWNDGMLFWEISFQKWQSGGTAGTL